MNKHYIRLNENNFIIKGFSDAFEEPSETDICINEDGGRHFTMFGEVNPSLYTVDGFAKYKYSSGKAMPIEENELELMRSNIKIPISETQKLWDSIDYLINSSY